MTYLKTPIVFFVVILASFLVADDLYDHTAASVDSTGFELFIEAEDGNYGDSWSLLEDELASGGLYIVSESVAHKSDPSEEPADIVYFDFDCDVAADDYKLWVRMRHPDGGNDDSFWLRMNGEEWNSWNQIADDLSDSLFHWDVYNGSFTLAEGANSLEIGIRENGSELDMVYISNSGRDPEGNSTLVSGHAENRLQSYQLFQNYPNPFNPSTTITFSVAERSKVQLAVYNVLGEQVALLVDEEREVGVYHIRFDASELTSGIYFYRLNTHHDVLTKKLTLLQ